MHVCTLGDGEYDMVHHSDGHSSENGSTASNHEFLITLNYKQVCVCVCVCVWGGGGGGGG